MPQVSVIIPTCNRPKLLPVAIRSVLGQTFRDLELVVVDDACDDCVIEIVNAFKDGRVRLIRHDSRRGGAAARNTGIRNSCGEYIAFLDDDDEWYPEKLARQMDVMLRAHPEVAGVYTGYRVVDRDSERICGRMIPSHRGNLCEQLLESNPIGGTSSMLLKRSCLDKVGLFDETLPSFQDRDLWIRISREFHFDYVQEPLLNYFLHSEKVWTNLEALTRGLEIMLEKYGSFPAFRRQCSYRYFEFGVRFCEAGQTRRAIQSLLKSISLYPFRIHPYLYLALTACGPRVFTMARESKTKYFPRLGASGLGR
jgi:glycosyltransferase involved in cell wall biosynthesis